MYQRSNIIILITIFLLCSLFFCKKTNSKQGSEPRSHPDSVQTNTLVAAAQQPTRLPEKWALLIGIDKYKHEGSQPRFSNLAGCVNDAMDMENLLIGKFGFKKDNIKMLINEQAKHSAIVQTFQDHLIGNAQKDDIVVVHFSGHGSQMKDISGDEPDGYDETIVPHDTRDSNGEIFDISDDEINGLLSELNKRTKNITLIIDACHSGTATRAAVGIRQIPPDDREPPREQPSYALTSRSASEGRSGMRRTDQDYALISACLEKESAYEHYAEQQEHGALTYFLVRELRNAGAGVTYQDVMENVRYKINGIYRNQHPQLEGTKRNNYVFSDSASIAQSYVLAFPKGSNKVKLQAGMAQGMTEGSVFEIFKPGTTNFDSPAGMIAKVELTKVWNFESEGMIDGDGRIENSSRAVERKHNYPDLKLRTYFLDLEDSPILQGIKAGLGNFGFIEFTDEQINYTLLIREKENHIVIEGPDTTEMTTPISIDNPDVQTHVIDDVQKWAKWFNVLAIENPNTSLEFEITLNTIDGEESIDNEQGARIPVVKNWESIECTVKNKSNKKLYFVILDLSSDGSITPIYPAEGSSEEINANSSWNNTIGVNVPENMNEVKDILKVFVTSEAITVSIFTQPAIKKGSVVDRVPQNLLEEFFSSATRGSSTTRGARVLNTGDWTTAQTVFKVVRD